MQWGSTLVCLLFPARLVVASDCTLPIGGFSSKVTCLFGEGGKDWQKKGRFANLKNAQLLSEFPTSSHSFCLITALLYHLITHLASKTQNHQCPGLLVVLEINKGSHDWNTLQKLLFSSADARYIYIFFLKQVPK